MRLVMIGGMVMGIGLAMLGIALYNQHIVPTAAESNVTFVYGAIVAFSIALVIGIIDTFTDWTGYVHPSEMLFSNVFTFIMGLAIPLVWGYFWYDMRSVFYTIAEMLVMAYIFLLVFIKVRFKISTEEELEMAEKVTTAKFLLIALLLGGVMAAVQYGMNWLYVAYDYGIAALILGGATSIFVIAMAALLDIKYEPVSAGTDVE